MGQAIGSLLPVALGIAISPVPIVAIVLMLATPAGRTNGPAFLIGWLLGVMAVTTIVLLLAGGIGASSSTAAPKTWVSGLKLALGLLLAWVSVRQWHGRPAGETEPAPPKWMAQIDTFGPVKASGLGALLSGVNPKNLLLGVSGGAVIAQAGLPGGQQAITVVIFAVIAALGPGIPLGIYYGMGERSLAVLDTMRSWLIRNNQAIMAVICLILAAKLVGEAIGGFSS